MPIWATGNNPPVAQRGFTLLEMLVVILLIGIAAGLLGLGVRQGLQVAMERRVVAQIGGDVDIGLRQPHLLEERIPGPAEQGDPRHWKALS